MLILDQLPDVEKSPGQCPSRCPDAVTPQRSSAYMELLTVIELVAFDVPCVEEELNPFVLDEDVIGQPLVSSTEDRAARRDHAIVS